MICADPQSGVVCLMQHGRCLVVDTQGHRLSPIISGNCDAGTKVAISGVSGLLCVGDSETGAIEAIEWATGRVKWHATRQGVLHDIQVFGKHVVLQFLDGSVAVLDGSSGGVRSTTSNVRAMACDTQGRAVLLHTNRLEFRFEPHGEAKLRFGATQPFHAAAFAEDGVVVAHPNGIVRFYDTRAGSERWRYDCGPGSLIGALGWCESAAAVFGIRFHRDHEHPPEAMLLDGQNGTVRNTAPTPDNISHPAVANRGEVALTSSWRCDIPSLSWTPWDTASFWP